MGICPGSESRNVSARDFACPKCGAAVEIFSDEPRRRCLECGASVTREATLTCAAWCPAARACLGVEHYMRLVEAGTIDGAERPTEPSE